MSKRKLYVINELNDKSDVEEKKHLYNARLGKVRWFVHRFGAKELALKPLRTVLAPLIIARLPERTFIYKGRPLQYLYHRYNMTWASERCVEVPIARALVAEHRPDSTLEVGNVLSHYGPVQHDILDKFERGDRVINQDVIEYNPAKGYDLIISVSTFEHIGYDDAAEGSSADKIRQAIDKCRGWLNAEGRLAITVPIGYNPELDELLRREVMGAEKESFLKKYGPLDWRDCSKMEALQCKYKEPFPYANAVGVLEFRKA